MCSHSKGLAIHCIDMGCVAFYAVKITISCCLKVVVLIEADYKSCKSVVPGFHMRLFKTIVWVITEDTILSTLWGAVCRFFVNLELELAISHG